MRRRTWLLAGGAALAAALIAGVLVVVLSGSDTSKTVPKASESVQLTVGTTSVESAGGAVAFPDDVKTQSMAALAGYVEAASVKPLRTGKADAAALSSVFEPTAAAKLTGPDRATLVDEGLPKSRGNIEATASVNLVGLAGTDGKVILANATFDLQIVTMVPKGPVRIQRTGSMLFAPVNGTWMITGWRLSVDRNAPGLPVTPTSATVVPPATSRSSATTTTKK
jgi:hypothetical protein